MHYDQEWSINNGKCYAGEGSVSHRNGLVNLIGVDYFGHAIYVELMVPNTDGRFIRSVSVENATLEQVARLTRVQQLYAHLSPVSDAGLDHLKGLTELSVLSVCGSQISDAGLADLAELTELSEPILSDTRVSDDGLRVTQRA